MNLDWLDKPEQHAALFVEETLDIDRSALVIVDMQRYWTDQTGPMSRMLQNKVADQQSFFYTELREVVIPHLASLLSAYRRAGLPIVHVTTGSTRSGGADLVPHLRRRATSPAPDAADFGALAVGGVWHEIQDELAPHQGEFVLNKTSRSAFSSTGIDAVLRNLGVQHVVVGGIASDGCALLTALDASDHGYDAFLVADGSMTFSEADHIAALQSFRRLWGSVVRTSDIVESISSDRELQAAIG